ncbi:MAG: integrase [Muricauda sp.]|nr:MULTISPECIES: tyrosine-type recombinase/integrase [unclassified Allomuricauda]MAU17532.1 integrase [Allomuricauda sp.]|tara:strand:- start:1205 stop:2536 length:1332 start_codon:yes stop_codon:yes gene_type:complete
MASVKIVLRKNMIRKDKTIPLAIRISENYKTSYKWLGIYVLEKNWDKTAGRVKNNHPNSKRVNIHLIKKLAEANDLFLNTENALTAKQAKQKLMGAGGSVLFFPFAVDRVKSKYNREVFSVAKSELSILYNLEEFLNLDKSRDKQEVIYEIKKRRKERVSKGRKGDHDFLDSVKYFKKKKDLKFQMIDEAFLEKYKNFCAIYLDQKPRTITNQLIFIRTLFNKAIKNGVVDAKFYPFGSEKEQIRIGTTHKIGLNKEEITKIESLNLETNTSIWHTKNVWLIAFYFAGIRISDVVKLQWTDFKDGRLLYVMNKNKKPVSLAIPNKADKILEYYKAFKTENNGYIFHFLKDTNSNNEVAVFRKTRNATKLFNKYLKRIAAQCGIEKNLSNHIARHSFGNIAGDTIHPLMLQKLYRHSDLKTTINYQANFIHKEADKALDSVVNF